jgi:molecular chaperone DnaK
VTAKDKATNKEQSIKITHSSGLTDSEIDKMKKDAKEHESEDKRRREEIDTRNHADSLVFQTEKQLKEFEDKLSSEAKMKVETAVGRLKEALKGTNTEEIKSSMDALNAAWNEVSTQMYSQATGDQKQQGFGSQAEEQTKGDGSEKKEDDKKVENADFEVIDDDSKK